MGGCRGIVVGVMVTLILLFFVVAFLIGVPILIDNFGE